MKNLKLIGFLMILATSLVFIQCTSDPIEGPQGVAGVDGIDGINGINGTNGVDGTASCVACHSDSHREPLKASFDLSKHNTGSAYGYAGGRGGDDATNRCAQCHSKEGYVDFITNGEANPDGYSGPSPISCTTCHDKHSTFDFENDGYDFALRSFEPVTLNLDANITIDFGGTSNNCVSCHQPRSSYEIPAGTEDYEITSKRFGPHHGPQSTVLEGIFGAYIAGSTPYPGVGEATHRTGASCVDCHMGESTDGSDGAHSWVPTANTCTKCHASAPSEMDGYTAKMAELQTLLRAKGILNQDDNYVVSGTYSADLAKAVWNYRTLLEDNSKGIHNPAYTRALLNNSIEVLQD